MTMKRIALASAFVLAAAGGARADAGQGWHHGFGGHEHGYLGFLHGVTLTDAQKTQVSDIEKSGWTQMKSNFQQMRAVHEQIMDQLASTAAVSKDQIESLVRQEAKLRTQADTARMAQVLAVRDILTPDQLAQVASIHQQMTALHAQEHALSHPEEATPE